MHLPLLLLAVGSVLLLLLSILFAVWTVVLRIRNERMAARWNALEAAWERGLLDVVAGAPPDPLRAAVDAADRLFFVDFVLRYARRLRGEDLERLHVLVRPLLGAVAERTRHDDAELRARAVRTIGLLGMPEHADAVVAALADPAPLVVMIAARVLCRHGQAAHFPAVLAALPRFAHWDRGFLASVLAGAGAEVMPDLRDAFGDAARPARARAVAAEALRILHDPHAPPLAAAAAVEALDPETPVEDSRDLRAAALRLLADVGGPEHLEAVHAATASPDAAVRAHAVTALGRLGGAADVPRLLAAMEDPSDWVAIRAAHALRSLDALPLLSDVARREGPRAALVREILAEAGAGAAAS